ncbi:MAG: SCO family protein [Winogradskyella sp.]|nr:SCO family protein [Winogradskyella sp.]
MSKKTSYSYVGISLVILVFGIIFIPKIIDRVNGGDITRDESRSRDVSSETKNETEKTTKSDLQYILNVDGDKKRVPSFSFTNQLGQTITNKDYLGKVYVVEFFFTTCPTICPRMNRNLLEIQNEFKDFENFGVASFTINPDIDTPDVLKAYAEKYEITNPNWHLMTGDVDMIYKLANEGFYLYTAKNEEIIDGFEHSGNFALIDKEGFIRSRLKSPNNPLIYYNGIVSEQEGVDDEGIPQEISILKEDIAKLLQE